MRGRRLITLPRPEGGAEHEVIFFIKHNCPASRLYQEGQETEDFSGIDELLMPVGIAGYEMPAGVPFEVVSMNECGACSKLVKAMFQWSTPKVFLP